MLEAFGELEYYLVDEPDPLFPVEEERGYQESAPFSKGERVREQVLGHLDAHGRRRSSTPTARSATSSSATGSWCSTRSSSCRCRSRRPPTTWCWPSGWCARCPHAHGLEATFAPSVSADGAGSGLHVHSRLVRDGASAIVDEQGVNDTGRRLVAGYLSAAAADRLRQHRADLLPALHRGDESPEGICWGEKDRTGLVRVPLAWGGAVLPGMVAHANPGSTEPAPGARRAPADGRAAPRRRLGRRPPAPGRAWPSRPGRACRTPTALELAERLRTADDDDPEQLPASCAESADALEAARALFEADGVFPPELLDAVLEGLRAARRRPARRRQPGGRRRPPRRPGPPLLVRRLTGALTNLEH